jgi:hypothetical protein
MWQYVAKVTLSAALVVAVGEIAKRSNFWAAAVALLPLTSLLAMVWLYVDSSDAGRVADLSRGIFWLVLPSLIFFVALPILLRAGWNFWLAMAI